MLKCIGTDYSSLPLFTCSCENSWIYDFDVYSGLPHNFILYYRNPMAWMRQIYTLVIFISSPLCSVLIHVGVCNGTVLNRNTVQYEGTVHYKQRGSHGVFSAAPDSVSYSASRDPHRRTAY